MQTTNKRIAFYTAIIGTILSVLLPALGLNISPEQQETLVAAMLMICAVFGIGDIGWDYINATRGNFDIVKTEKTETVSMTNTSTPDDSKVTTTVSHSEFAG